MFENISHERSLMFLLSPTYSNKLKQAKFTDHEINLFKNIALEKLHRQRVFKEYTAIQLLD